MYSDKKIINAAKSILFVLSIIFEGVVWTDFGTSLRFFRRTKSKIMDNSIVVPITKNRDTKRYASRRLKFAPGLSDC